MIESIQILCGIVNEGHCLRGFCDIIYDICLEIVKYSANKEHYMSRNKYHYSEIGFQHIEK